jgi:hypothetical protein
MRLTLLLSILFAIVCVEAQNLGPNWADATFKEIITAYQEKVFQISVEIAKENYRAQLDVTPPIPKEKIISMDAILQEQKKASEKILKTVQSITYGLLLEAQNNPKREYFIWNSESNSWHLPGVAAPSPRVDGAYLNAKKLEKKIKDSISQATSSGYMGVQKRGFESHSLRKRFWGTIFGSVDNGISGAVNQVDNIAAQVDNAAAQGARPPNGQYQGQPGNSYRPNSQNQGGQPFPNGQFDDYSNSYRPYGQSQYGQFDGFGQHLDQPPPRSYWQMFKGQFSIAEVRRQISRYFSSKVVRYTIYFFGATAIFLLIKDKFKDSQSATKEAVPYPAPYPGTYPDYATGDYSDYGSTGDYSDYGGEFNELWASSDYGSTGDYSDYGSTGRYDYRA